MNALFWFFYSEDLFRMSSPLKHTKAWPLLQMQHCSSVQLLLGNVLSTSFHMLAGKENEFTCIYTRSQCDLYTVTKSQKIGCEHRRLRRPGGREAGKEEEASSAPLCSSSDSTGDPAAVNLKAEDHSSLLVFFLSPFPSLALSHISVCEWLSVFDLGSLHLLGKSQ